jgi:hypothetical protein
MASTEKLLRMLSSEKSSTRYDACEWLRIHPTSSHEIIYALQTATYDLDPEVASRARNALLADVHHHQAVAMGLALPDERDGTTASPPLVALPSAPTDKLQADYAAMLKEIRSWAIWSLLLGVIQLISFGVLDSAWGVLLLIVGLASFFFHTSAMFIIFGVTLIWAAINNFAGLQVVWIGFSLLQIYWAVRIFMAYRRFNLVESQVLASSSVQPFENRSTLLAARIFPWVGAFLGGISFLGLLGGLLLDLVVSIETGGNAALPSFLYFFLDLMINMGVLGFALGLASVLSKFRFKFLSILALVASSLTLLIALIFIVVSMTV